jgi:hypothetical protein
MEAAARAGGKLALDTPKVDRRSDKQPDRAISFVMMGSGVRIPLAAPRKQLILFTIL